MSAVVLEQGVNASAPIAPPRERPILFSAPMVRAILDGRKTQTRRVIKPQPSADPDVWFINASGQFCARTHGADWTTVTPPYGQPGDRLWVRETFSGPYGCSGIKPSHWPEGEDLWFWADGNPQYGDWTRPVPSIHMPRWASRITLQITDVRVERLNDCSEPDAIAEGVIRDEDTRAWLGAEAAGLGGATRLYASPVRAYADLWESINGPGSWGANPWVWVVEFERVPHA